MTARQRWAAVLVAAIATGLALANVLTGPFPTREESREPTASGKQPVPADPSRSEAPTVTPATPPRLVRGRVVDADGVPVAGALVTVRREVDWAETAHALAPFGVVLAPIAEGLTAADGGFELELPGRVSTARFRVSAWGRSGATLGGPSIVVPHERTVDVLDLQLGRGGSITGHVYDAETGQPIPEGVQVRVRASGATDSLPLDGPWPVRTDEHGSFTLLGLPAGEVVLEFVHPAYLVGRMVHDASVPERVVHELHRPRETIRGFLLDGEGNPIRGATVRARSEFDGGEVLSGSCGEFEVPVDGESFYELAFTLPGHRETEWAWVDCKDDEVHPGLQLVFVFLPSPTSEPREAIANAEEWVDQDYESDPDREAGVRTAIGEVIQRFERRLLPGEPYRGIDFGPAEQHKLAFEILGDTHGVQDPRTTTALVRFAEVLPDAHTAVTHLRGCVYFPRAGGTVPAWKDFTPAEARAEAAACALLAGLLVAEPSVVTDEDREKLDADLVEGLRAAGRSFAAAEVCLAQSWLWADDPDRDPVEAARGALQDLDRLDADSTPMAARARRRLAELLTRQEGRAALEEAVEQATRALAIWRGCAGLGGTELAQAVRTEARARRKHWALSLEELPVVAVPNNGSRHSIALGLNRRLASLSGRSVTLVDLTTPNRSIDIGAADGVLRCVAFRPGTNLLATGVDSGDLVLWDIAGGGRQELPHEGVSFVAFSASGTRVATARSSGEVRLWSLDGPEPVFEEHPTGSAGSFLNGLALAPGGLAVALSSEAGVERWWTESLDAQPILALTTTHGGPLAFSGDGALLAAGGEPGGVSIWRAALEADPARTRIPLEADLGRAPSEALCWVPELNVLVVGGKGWVLVVDPDPELEDGERILRRLDMRDGSRAIMAVAVSPDGGWLAAASSAGTVRVWERVE